MRQGSCNSDYRKGDSDNNNIINFLFFCKYLDINISFQIMDCTQKMKSDYWIATKPQIQIQATTLNSYPKSIPLTHYDLCVFFE